MFHRISDVAGSRATPACAPASWIAPKLRCTSPKREKPALSTEAAIRGAALTIATTVGNVSDGAIPATGERPRETEGAAPAPNGREDKV